MTADRVWNGRTQAKVDEPFDVIRVGDVIRWNGRLRTVRLVRRTEADHLQIVGFAKLKRSGYRSPLTLYWRSEIRNAFGGIVAHRKDLCAVDLECELTEQIEEAPRTERITERDTVGVIW